MVRAADEEDTVANLPLIVIFVDCRKVWVAVCFHHASRIVGFIHAEMASETVTSSYTFVQFPCEDSFVIIVNESREVIVLYLCCLETGDSFV